MVEEVSKKRKVDTEAVKASEKKLTNRQKRKKLNEKNKWPQHPKIQSMDQRAKAYIRVAGLGTSTKAKETIDPKLDLMSAEVKFGRLLGGTDQRKRHAAVNKLKAYLRARCDIQNENGGISELDLLKLWKGLWYTLYMADKVPVQDELSKCLAELLWCVAGTEEEDEYAGQAYLDMCEEFEKATADDFDDEDVTMEEIVNTLREEVGEEDEDEDESENEEEESNEDDISHDHDEEHDGDEDEEEEESVDDATIPHCRGAHLASMFIRTFFRTVRREWGKMDKYRVDKFYTLIRMYMHEVFKYMATRHWNLGIIRLFNDAMFEEVLNQTPNGLRYHLIDIALEELAKANAKAPMQLTEATFLDALEPYFAMCQTGAGDDTIQHRVLEKVGERFIEEYSVVSDKALEGDDDSDEENAEDSLIFEQVHVGSVAQFIFELASDPETKDRYRKSLYDLHKKYVRQVKKAGTDVELHEDHEDEDHVHNEDCEHNEEDAMQYEIEDVEENEVDEEADKAIGNETEAVDKKGKKKQKKEAKAAEIIEEDEPVDNVMERKEGKKKKKKKKKKKGTASADHEEETLTISLSEQKKATAESKKQGKSKTEDSESGKAKGENGKAKGGKSKPDGPGGRRVKFTSTNKSKSFKASMKALVTCTPPKGSIKSPEKSILRRRVMPAKKFTEKKHPKKAKGKAGRKRAVNYF